MEISGGGTEEMGAFHSHVDIHPPAFLPMLHAREADLMDDLPLFA